MKMMEDVLEGKEGKGTRFPPTWESFSCCLVGTRTECKELLYEFLKRKLDLAFVSEGEGRRCNHHQNMYITLN